jgi:hypothetical protein
VPVSSPSYFPPNSSTDQVRGINTGPLATGSPLFLAGQSAGKGSSVALIVIGHQSAEGGVANSVTNLNGSIVIGNGSLQLWVSGNAVGASIPVTLVGANSFSQASQVDSTVCIGSGICNDTAGCIQATIVGNNILNTVNTTGSGTLGIRRCVIMGQTILTGASGPISAQQNSVIIGDTIFASGVTCPTINNGVFIGANISGGNEGGLMAGNVAIGNTITLNEFCSGNVLIGSGVTATGLLSANSVSENVVIGASCSYDGNSNVIIGNGATCPTPLNNASVGNVVIGFSAGTSVPANNSAFNNLLIIESTVGVTVKTIFYGSFATGNLIIGQSTNAANRDFGGTGATNIVKLLNGTAGNAAPIGGGYFYVTGGVLHWVDSSGNDTTLSTPAAPTTGASTATFVATNKPGATTGAGPVAWENRVIDGVSYQSPLWAT